MYEGMTYENAGPYRYNCTPSLTPHHDELETLRQGLIDGAVYQKAFNLEMDRFLMKYPWSIKEVTEAKESVSKAIAIGKSL